MKSKAREAVASLREIKTSGRKNWIHEFESGLAEVIELHDPTCIPLLMDLLEDGCGHDEVMFAIIHTIERFADEPYVASLISQTPRLAGSAPKWLGVLYMRVLNSESAREALARELKSSPLDQRRAVLAVVDEISTRRPEFARRLIAIRTAALPS